MALIAQRLPENGITDRELPNRAATGPKGDIKNGAYYTPVGVLSKPSGYGQDDKMAQALWEWTEKELASKGF